MNQLKIGVLFLLVTLTAACGGKPKDAATTTTEPSSQSYPPQNPGDANPSDTLSIAPPASGSAGEPASNRR